MKSLDKFLLIEKNINGIFEEILDVTLDEPERLNLYLEKKNIIDEIKKSLTKASKSKDKIISEKCLLLLEKINSNLSTFGNGNLNMNDKTIKEPFQDSITSSEIRNDYMLIQDGTVVYSMKCTKEELVGYLNANYGDQKVLPMIVSYDEVSVKTKTKTVYDI